MRATQSHIIIIIVVAVVVGQGEWKSGRTYETIRLYADYYTYTYTRDAKWLRDAVASDDEEGNILIAVGYSH